MKQTFAILYYIPRSRKDRLGRAPIYCRITICGSSTTFSTRLKVEPDRWSQPRQRVRGHAPYATEHNSALNQLREKIEREYIRLLQSPRELTAKALREVALPSSRPSSAPTTLLGRFDRQIEKLANHVGTDRAVATYNKYRCVRNHLARFLLRELRVADIAIDRFTPQIFSRLVAYLRAEGCSNNTIWLYLMPLRALLRRAHEEGLVENWSPDDYSFGFSPRQRMHLNKSELQQIEAYAPNSLTEATVREIFLFGCYTGLSWVDIRNLRWDNIIHLDGGKRAICSMRQKSHQRLYIPLLPAAERILYKQGSGVQNGCESVFCVPSNRLCNLTLRTIAKQCGIAKHLTFHLSRHTFATTIALENGVPIESVSRLLGHASIRTTQIYATVTNRKLESDMSLLSNTLNTSAQDVHKGKKKPAK